jgi:chemotaxis signal transduction protein
MAEKQQLVLSQTTLLSATTGKLDLYILPLWQKKLLLPTSAVVEIISSSQLKPSKKNKKQGILGQVTWEQETIPVISFETFNGDTQSVDPQKIAIVIAVHLGDVQYYGIALQAEPVIAKVKIAEIEDLDQAVVGAVEYLQVRYQNQLCVIPDLDSLEQKLLEVI